MERIGDPGVKCRDCPYSKFGSVKNPDGSQGTAQACKELRQVLLLLPGAMLPHLVNIPPTSIRPFSQYQIMLVSAKAPYWGVTTKLTLQRATNEGGINYSRIRFRLGHRLKPTQQRNFDPYRRRMAELLIPSVVEATTDEID